MARNESRSLHEGISKGLVYANGLNKVNLLEVSNLKGCIPDILDTFKDERRSVPYDSEPCLESLLVVDASKEEEAVFMAYQVHQSSMTIAFGRAQGDALSQFLAHEEAESSIFYRLSSAGFFYSEPLTVNRSELFHWLEIA